MTNDVKTACPEQGRRVYVGMSGGVDSSLSAALLKEQGYDVTGVFIKVWQPQHDLGGCQWKEDRLDAMRVAAGLGIPFKTLDLEQEYKQGVIDYMLSEYQAGRVPNPDVMCNSEVKFGAFLEWAKKEGADFVATGHYAQREKKDGSVYLKKGKDEDKDQSYFLYRLTQNELAHILFPIGHLRKPEVRQQADERGLSTALKKDSQGLCFIGKVDIQDFLKEHIETKEGDVLNTDGDVIGTHDGAMLFTLGQRHGFTIFKKGTNEAPQYVVAKDIEKNTITVSDAREQKEVTDVVTLEDVSWVGKVPEHGAVYDAVLRYHGKAYRASIRECSGDTARVQITGLSEALVPGQSIVLYDGTCCVGGGIVA